MMLRAIPELKILVGTLIGTGLCLWLFSIMLPAIGLGAFARQFEPLADKTAPCLLSPIVAWLVVRLRRYGVLSLLLSLAGSVTFLFFLFVIYDPPKMIVGLVLLVAAVVTASRAQSNPRR